MTSSPIPTDLEGRANRAEFLLALMAACKPQTEIEHIEECNSLRDRALERTIAAQSAEASLSALRREVGEVLGPFATVGRLMQAGWGPALWKPEEPFRSGAAWTENGETRTLTYGDLIAAARLHASVSGQQDQSAFGGEGLGASGGREAGRLQAPPTAAPSVAGWWVDCPNCNGNGRVIAHTSRICTRCTNGRIWLPDPAENSASSPNAEGVSAGNIPPDDPLNLVREANKPLKTPTGGADG